MQHRPYSPSRQAHSTSHPAFSIQGYSSLTISDTLNPHPLLANRRPDGHPTCQTRTMSRSVSRNHVPYTRRSPSHLSYPYNCQIINHFSR
ncbi:hypothetical protein BDR06DRAFT_728736 [Suillus hirtellus]|nr:hypothetical protein BDR06DRAFT_728736 [Suillus hirtellus]